jgi:polyphosphate kinase
VEIVLIVRGFCCLSPGAPGVSEQIRVLSVVGRFLEHSRVFCFRNGAADPLDGAFFIGSADWMYRNLQARVEAIAPIETRALREQIWEILQILMRDQRQTWDMRPDGAYVQRQPGQPGNEAGAHEVLMQLTRRRQAPA